MRRNLLSWLGIVSPPSRSLEHSFGKLFVLFQGLVSLLSCDRGIAHSFYCSHTSLILGYPSIIKTRENSHEFLIMFLCDFPTRMSSTRQTTPLISRPLLSFFSESVQGQMLYRMVINRSGISWTVIKVVSLAESGFSSISQYPEFALSFESFPRSVEVFHCAPLRGGCVSLSERTWSNLHISSLYRSV